MASLQISREEMLKRVAHFKDLVPNDFDTVVQSGVNPLDWTDIRRETVPAAGCVAPRTAPAASSRVPNAVCVCCRPGR